MVVDAASHQYHRSRFESRYQTGVSATSSLPLADPYPRRATSFPGPCHSRITALGPAFRVLEYYRARHGAAPRRPPHSHPPSPLSYPSPLSPLVRLALLHVGPASSLILGTNFRGSFKTTRAPDHRILHLSAFSVHIPSFFLFPSFFLNLFCATSIYIRLDLF